MSNLYLKTANPFRNDLELPRLRYSSDSDPYGFMCGIRKPREDFTRIQYIPSDSPYHDNTWKPNTSDYKIDQMLYTVNKHGFRGDNFNKEDDAIMFLGCSHTFGVGVSDEAVWCRNVADRRNKKCWNLGIPGGGNQLIYMVLDSFLESGYRPSEVVILWTHVQRKLLFHSSTFNKMAEQNQRAREEILEHDLQKEIEVFAPSWLRRDSDFKEAHEHWALMSENHEWFDFYNHRCQILNLLKLHNLPFIEMHCLPEQANFCQNLDRIEPWHYNPYNMVVVPEKQKDLARDGLHWGPKSNRVAEGLYFQLLKRRQG